jgi:hypothetical protein
MRGGRSRRGGVHSDRGGSGGRVGRDGLGPVLRGGDHGGVGAVVCLGGGGRQADCAVRGGERAARQRGRGTASVDNRVTSAAAAMRTRPSTKAGLAVADSASLANRQLRNRRQGCHDPDDRDGCLGARPQCLTRDRHDGPRADDASGDRPVAPIRLGRAVARDIRRPGSSASAGAWPSGPISPASLPRATTPRSDLARPEAPGERRAHPGTGGGSAAV